MIRRKYLNLTHFLIPLSIIFIVLSFIFKKQSLILFEMLVLFALIYVVSILVHHHFDKSLTKEVAAEYILLALLVIIMVANLVI
jgi:hypothetical protein